MLWWILGMFGRGVDQTPFLMLASLRILLETCALGVHVCMWQTNTNPRILNLLQKCTMSVEGFALLCSFPTGGGKTIFLNKWITGEVNSE